MSESNFGHCPNRHIAFFENLDIDALLLEESELIEDIHQTTEQNGSELSEAELLFEAFRHSKEG